MRWSDGRLDHHKGKKKNGDEVDDEDDDNVVRTSVSQDRATATLYTENLFLSTEFIKLFPHIIQVKYEGGGNRQSTRHISGQPGLTPLNWTSSWFPELLLKLDIFYNYFVTEEDNYTLFLFPAIHQHIPPVPCVGQGFKTMLINIRLLQYVNIWNILFHTRHVITNINKIKSGDCLY